MQAQSLGQEDHLEEEMATHYCILAWKNPMDRGAWQSTVHRIRLSTYTCVDGDHEIFQEGWFCEIQMG